MIFIFICIMPELSQLLVASFSCEPHLYFFTGRYSEPCRFRYHVALGTLSLLFYKGPTFNIICNYMTYTALSGIVFAF